MKSRYFFIGILCLLNSTIFAQQLQTEKLDIYAKAAFRYYASVEQQPSQLKIKDSFTQEEDGHEYYHIFNFENGGFVILSGRNDYDAVLGFSASGKISFEQSERNDGLWGELSKHKDSMGRIIRREIKASPSASKQWSRLKQLVVNDSNLKSISFNPVIGPLTTTKWTQSGYYNDHIPIDATTIERGTNAGCVPIAIAQALRYYASPMPGSGYVSYEDPRHGTQSVDYCGKNFDYENMPDSLSEPNSNLAQFIYEVGVSMETEYSDRKTGTYRSKIPGALIYNFGFDPELSWFTSVDSERYSETVRGELDAGRIVVLAAKRLDEEGSIQGGHCWIADGYGYTADNVEYVHMNWGWGGNDNGWFLDTPGAWVPHMDNVDEDDIGYYYYRTTYYNIKPAQEFCVAPESRNVEVDPNGNYAKMYNNRSDDELVKFRFRESGTSQWIETNQTFESKTLVSNLREGTIYEYQSARNCCGEWSTFSDTAEFSTTGTAPIDDDAVDECLKENPSELSVSAVKDDFAYVYTSRPNGRVNNQFRFRKLISGGEWTETEVENTHYRALRSLNAGTSYEYQVKHECSTGNWSVYSESFVFTTTGTAVDDNTDPHTDDVTDDNTDPNCQKEDPAKMKTSSVRENSAYVYTRQPNGAINNVFRYRVVGTIDWTVTSVDHVHYRALRDLQADTKYEYQVNHICGDNSNSGYSDSYIFTTSGTTSVSENDVSGNNSQGDNTEMPVDDGCHKENPTDMKVSGVSDDFAYLYTRFPNGRINNLFRYRVIGSDTWIVTNESDKHYRAIRGLASNTTYEYQVNHKCSVDAWSGWSASFMFGTEDFVVVESTTLRSRELPLPRESINAQLKIFSFPNPTSEHLNVVIEADFKREMHSSPTLEIIEQTGRVIRRYELGKLKEIRINISDLPGGIYFLRYLDANDNNALNRFIKI